MFNDTIKANQDIFRECLSARLIEKFTPEPTPGKARRGRKRQRHGHEDSWYKQTDVEVGEGDGHTKPEELADFIEVSILARSLR